MLLSKRTLVTREVLQVLDVCKETFPYRTSLYEFLAQVINERRNDGGGKRHIQNLSYVHLE